MRLIDADALMKCIPIEEYCSRLAVANAPTVDAEPERKKGKWVAIGNTGLAACKCGFFTDRYRAYNFCPNCGDEMKGEDDENNGQI